MALIEETLRAGARGTASAIIRRPAVFVFPFIPLLFKAP
jgi:hypothetical protein